MREILGAIAFSLLWPAAAAVSMAVGARGEDLSTLGCTLLAVGTAGAYALDRLRDGGDGLITRRILGLAILACAAVSIAILIAEPWRWAFVIILSALAIAYVPLKRRIPKNAIATLAWTLAVVILPGTAPPLGDGRHLIPSLAVACIMFANTTICDFATVDEDRRRGVKSICVCYSVLAARIAVLVVSLAGTVLAAADAKWGLAIAMASHAVVAIVPTRHARLWVDAAITLLPGPIALLVG